MKTDVDTCLRDIAGWYVRNRREITPEELQSIVTRHCESEAEIEKFLKFLETEPGQLRFRTLLKERKGESKPTRKLTFLDLQKKLWTPGELAEYPVENLQALRKEVGRAISISPFDTSLRITDDLLRDAIKYKRPR